jgi:hypothetical protein
MEATSKWTELLRSFLEQLPSLLTFAGCIIFVIIRWKWYPKVSLILLVALIVGLIHEIVFTVVYNWVPGWFIPTGTYDPIVTRNVYLVLGLITNTSAGAIVLLYLAAIFMNRPPQSV